jgi:hypothetical protein
VVSPNKHHNRTIRAESAALSAPTLNHAESARITLSPRIDHEP